MSVSNPNSDSIERWSHELRKAFEQLRVAHSQRKKEPEVFVRQYESSSGILIAYEGFTRWRDTALLSTFRRFVDEIESDYLAECERVKKRELWDKVYAPRPWEGGRADGNR